MTSKECLEIIKKARKQNIRANLCGANLCGADLYGADLCGADLYRADLYRADLRGADLRGANLRGADLRGANLCGADLCGANLRGADLCETCLDIEFSPNKEIKGFKKVRGYVIGYRTREAGHIKEYKDGQFYSADWFSVSDTECHPGLYLWPALEQAKEFSGNVEFIKVRTKPTEVHKAGNKWSCRWFEVLGKIE